jgi:TrwC relaxase
MLTISKLTRWSINYYIDTAQAAEYAARDRARAGGGLGEYYSERETRTPTWLLAGDTHVTAALVGLTDIQRVGGDADAQVVARRLDEGIAPNGAHGRAFGERGEHGFDLTFCAPKSVSLIRALRSDDVVAKAIADAHGTALLEAMDYLAAHAGYTRVHNPHTGEKDLVRLPGLTAIAYQHETSPRDTATSRRSTATGRRPGPADWVRSRRCAGADPRTAKAGKQTRWSSPGRRFAQVYAEPLHG